MRSRPPGAAYGILVWSEVFALASTEMTINWEVKTETKKIFLAFGFETVAYLRKTDNEKAWSNTYKLPMGRSATLCSL